MDNAITIKTNTTMKTIKNNTCAAIFALGLCFALINVFLPKQHIGHLSSLTNAHVGECIVH